jgi:hypothetical protein
MIGDARKVPYHDRRYEKRSAHDRGGEDRSIPLQEMWGKILIMTGCEEISVQ